MEKQTFYFTFGSDNKFPFGFKEYIKIIAENIFDAQLTFQQNHPNRPGSELLNYAFDYTEEAWKRMNMCAEYYDNKEPSEILISDKIREKEYAKENDDLENEM